MRLSLAARMTSCEAGGRRAQATGCLGRSRPPRVRAARQGLVRVSAVRPGAQHPEMQQTVPHREDLPSKTVSKATGEAQPSTETHHRLRKLRSSDVGTLPEATVRVRVLTVRPEGGTQVVGAVTGGHVSPESLQSSKESPDEEIGRASWRERV